MKINYIQRLFLGMVFLSASMSLFAQTWTGATSTDWATASNWNTGAAPTGSAVIYINNTANQPILNSGTVSITQSLRVETGASLTIASGATITLAANTTAVSLIGTGVLIVNGNLTVTSASGSAIYVEGTLTINNGGVATLNGTSQSGIYLAGSVVNNGTLNIGSSTTIGDKGIFLNSTASLTNTGTITIDRTAGDGIDHSGTSFNNSGTLNIGQNSATGGLGIENWASVTNSGIIRIDNTRSNLFVQRAGTFTNSAGAQLNIGQLATNSYLGIYNAANFINSGTVNVDRMGTDGVQHYGTTFTNNTSGIINIGVNGGANNITGVGFRLNQPLTNAGTISIKNTTAVGLLLEATAANTANSGTMSVEATAGDAIENSAAGFSNSGTIHIGQNSLTGGYGFENWANATNSGTINIDNTRSNGFRQSNGTFTNATGAQLNIGLNSATNKINGSCIFSVTTFSNSGNISVQNPIYHGIENTGTFTNNSSGSIAINATVQDAINSTSVMTNAGTINIGQISAIGRDGYRSSAAATFTNNGAIFIDRVVWAGWNELGGFINNATKTLSIGQLAGTTINDRGFLLTSTANFNNAGTITIDRTVRDGFDNSTTTFANTGTINIGQNAATSVYGFENWASMTNQGIINIDNITSEAFAHRVGTFTNASGAQLKIGLNGAANNIGSDGAYLAATFVNAGTVSIKNTANRGIVLLAAATNFSNTGTISIEATTGDVIENSGPGFSNTGTINIGQAGLTGGHGFENWANATNSGTINIDNIKEAAFAQRAGTFTNASGGQLKVGLNSPANGLLKEGIYTAANFTNGGTIAIKNTTFEGIKTASNTFANTGTIAIDNTGTGGLLTGSAIQNSGAINIGLATGGITGTALFLGGGNTVNIAGTTAGSTSGYGQADVVGTVNLNTQTLYLSGSYVPVAGNTFTIIKNDGTDAITGTFNGLAQGATITFNGVPLYINYLGGTGNDVVLSVASPLPVELLNFTAKNTEGGNILTWATANEINNKGFQVERQQATGDRWDILGFVVGNGKAYTYNFVDNAPLSTSYYRLRQLDNDGTETFSKVVSVTINKNNKLIIYPNPVSNILTVETEQKGDFQIFNLLGQQVLNGKTVQRIDVSALPQGTYFLKLGAAQVKFIKD